MYKLVAIDMDETLLNDDAEISPKNVSVLKKAIKDGVKVVLNTGRSYLSVQENLKTLGIYQTKDQYVVSFNGGAIVENKDLKVVHVEGLAFDIVKQLFDISLRASTFILWMNYTCGMSIKTKKITCNHVE
nr:HAD family hydrolase [Ligilactobacillus salivarius]